MKQGLIYRGAYIVNWCPRCQTAISDLEVIHEEQQGKLWEIRYPIVGEPGFVTVATTRPETMLGDVAVAVHPDDERYAHLHGKMLRLPLTGREIPIVTDSWVSREFGTGAVKVTPAHDPNDFALGQRQGLPSISVMDETAHMNAAAGAYAGLDRYKARQRVLDDLEAQHLLAGVRDHVNSIGKCDRCKTVVEPLLSTQWFIRIQPLADKAIAAVEQGFIRFTPEQYAKTYFEWMRNIHDWCISRQLWWGHRIPAWHCAACGKITVARTTPEVCAHCGSDRIEQEKDVLDTWFSSGLLPCSTLGWPEHTPDLDAFYPTRLLVTGFDILFFWVARMIMLGCHFMLEEPLADGSKRTLKDAVPFREVYIHALVRDADRQKMSKTKGNVIDPIQVVERFGTDAVRFTLAAMAAPGTDIAFSEERTDGYRAFANKIWNAARFIFMQMERAAEAGIVGRFEPASGGACPGNQTPHSKPDGFFPACIALRARSTWHWGSIASTKRPTRSTASSGAISATGTSRWLSCVLISAAPPPQYARRWPPCWGSSSRPCACCLRLCPLSPRRSGTRSTKIILRPGRSRSHAILRRSQNSSMARPSSRWSGCRS